ncbi:ABC transporter ATP-binding protein [Johnsonella ignava]|nr:ABC transporter ATP-binding protein [Johnsonella ignava]
MLKIIFEVLKLSGKYRSRINLAFAISFVKSLLMKVPVIMSVILLENIYNKSLNTRLCVNMALILLAALIIQYIAQNAADRLQSGAGYKICADYRLKLGEHLRRLPMGYFTEGNIGKISSVLSTDIVFIEENSMSVIADLMSYLFAAFIMIIFMFFFNVEVGITTLLASVIIYIFGLKMKNAAVNDSKLRQDQSEKLTDAVLEFVSGISIIKSYNILGESSEKLRENFKESCKKSIDFEENFSSYSRNLVLLYAGATAAVFLIASRVYILGYISIVSYIGILLFTFDLFAPIRMFFQQVLRLTVMEACLNRMKEVLEEPELEDGGSLKFEADSDNEIEFKDVYFAYNKTEVLHGITFDIKKNTMTALVGPSGSGKSTIAALIARFWDIQSGQILVKGRNIKEVSLADLMDNISMVFQRVYLFRDTIYANIAMGRPDAGKEEVIEAAKRARCYDFIMELENGFDTVIEEGGASLSGGERQRISIARCILKNTPIIILDEATASVDADNESLIQEAISELCRGRTLIVIAHRLKTIKDADNILVIADGRIAEQGSHKELMEQEGIYNRFVKLRQNDKGWERQYIASKEVKSVQNELL